MHTADEIHRHNYRIIRAAMKGKPKTERLRTYAALRLGPLGLPLMLAWGAQPIDIGSGPIRPEWFGATPDRKAG